MMLHRSIPLIFGVPSVKLSLLSIILSFLLLLLATSSYVASIVWADFPFFACLTIILFVHACVGFFSSGYNLLFIFRFFLIWILIFVTALMWSIYDGDVLVAPFGIQYQTYENTRIIVFSGFLSLCGSLIGWNIARLQYCKRIFPEFFLSNLNRQIMLVGGAIISTGFGLFYFYVKGGAVGVGAAYGQNTKDIGFTFGVFNIFQFFGIALLLISAISRDGFKRYLLWLAIFTLILGVLAGSRADYLPQAFIIFMLVFNKQISALLAKGQYYQLFKWFIYAFSLLLIGYYSSLFLALWRTGINLNSIIDILLNTDRAHLINSIYGHRMLYLETGNMILGGFYGAVVNVQEGITGYLYGSSYIDYLIKSPPAFLGLERPLGLEWYTDINGQRMSQGGIFEVAEAYWNFGYLGCFFVSMIISYFYGWFLINGLFKNNYFLLSSFIVIGFMSFRSIWYQNFGYFRIITILLIIYFISMIFIRWFVANRRKLHIYLQL